METKKATIKRQESTTFLVLELNSDILEIILTEDNPNNIKIAFNSLLKELKKGPFEFILEDDKNDMYYHICQEYIRQLNSEINTIYSELQEYQLTNE